MEARKSKLPDIPDDIITDILLISPLKSIGRFKCLSKFFHSLLTDPKFVRNQLELTLRRRSNSDNRRLIMSPSQKLFLVNLDSMDLEHEYSFKEDLIRLNKRTHIIGSSNGLVCFRCEDITKDKEDEVLLYNPITKDSKIIPELPKSVHHHLFYSYEFGFGFDALSNDYKVLKLVSCKENKHNKYTICYVYSLKTDSWKRINHQLPYYTHVYDSNAYLKGTIHWIALTEGLEDRNVLIAFDLEKDELREMTLPNWVDESHMPVCYFAVDTFKGCLYVVHGFFKMCNIIWVMKENGLESSWCKINVTEYSSKPTLCLGAEGHLVFDGHFAYKKMKNPMRNSTRR